MYGRFVLRTPSELLARAPGVELPASYRPRYDITPTQPILAMKFNARSGCREAASLRWGLIPARAKDPRIGAKMINARAETLTERSSFRNALRTRRCLIPADGWYEWRHAGAKRQPYFFQIGDGKPFAFAGLWECRPGDNGDWIESCAIITTRANDAVESVHDRMPAILPAEHHDLWLDPAVQNAEQVQPLLKPYSSEALTVYPVSTRVNSGRADTAQLTAPVGHLK